MAGTNIVLQYRRRVLCAPGHRMDQFENWGGGFTTGSRLEVIDVTRLSTVDGSGFDLY